MAYSETLAERVRRALADRDGVTERKMFGGLAFMLGGNMCCGVLGNELVVRVGPERYGSARAHPHARAFDFTGRPMKGFVVVSPAGCAELETLGDWIGIAVDFAGTLTPN
jgi:hypothetical protein